MLKVTLLQFKLYARVSPYIANIWELCSKTIIKILRRNVIGNKKMRGGIRNAARRLLLLPMPVKYCAMAKVILDFKVMRKVASGSIFGGMQEMWEDTCDFLGIACAYPGTENRYASALWRSNPELFWSHARDLDDRSFTFLRTGSGIPAFYRLVDLGSVDTKEVPRMELDAQNCCLLSMPDGSCSPNVAYDPTGQRDLQYVLNDVLALPMYDESRPDLPGFIVAGGSIVAVLSGMSLMEISDRNMDIDLFGIAPLVMGTTAAEIKQHIAPALENAFVDALKCNADAIVSDRISGQVRTIFVDTRGYNLKLQIVRRAFPTPAHVVHGFDIDACTVLMTRQRTWITPRGLRALTQGWNLLDQTKLSLTAVQRYCKYMRRYGFKVLIPGVSEDRKNVMVIEASRLRHLNPASVMLVVNRMESTVARIIIHVSCNYIDRLDSDYEAQPSARKWWRRIGEGNFFEWIRNKIKRSDPSIAWSCWNDIVAHSSTGKPLFTGAFNPVRCDMYCGPCDMRC